MGDEINPNDMQAARAAEIERIRMWAIEQVGMHASLAERLHVAAGIVDFVMNGALPDSETPPVNYKATMIFDPPARTSAQQWKGI